MYRSNFNSKSDLCCVKEYSYIRMPMPIPLLVTYWKEGECCRDENVWFSILLNAYQVFWSNSNNSKRNLLGIYMFKVDNSNIRTRYETCLKFKNLKNKRTRTTLSQLCSVVFIFSFKHYFILGACVFILTLNIKMTDGNVACAF